MSVFNDINRQKMRIAQRALMAASVGRFYESARLHKIRLALARGFLQCLANERHWIIASTDFSLLQLKEARPGRFYDEDLYYTRLLINGKHEYFGHELIDHAEYFRLPDRPWRPSALLTHCYETPERMLKLATLAGFDIEFLPWSWYYVDSCTAALLTRKTVEQINAQIQPAKSEA